MNEKYYKIEDISKMLGLHPKTVGRYIREGKLRATKVGKQWLVTGHDLSVFAEGNSLGVSQDSGSGATVVTISTVIDVNARGREDGIRILNTMTALLNGKPRHYGESSMNAQWIEPEHKVRILLWGSLPLTRFVLDAVETLTEGSAEGESAL